MNWLSIFVISLLAGLLTNPKEVLVKGIVVDETTHEPLIGAMIKIGRQATIANVNGEFVLHLKYSKEDFPIIIEYPSSPTLHILDVGYDQVSIDLGKVELMYNKMVSIEEYKRTSKSDRIHMEPIKHYSTLLGYIYNNKVDSINLIGKCKDLNGNLLPYKYDSSKNQISIIYNNLKCL